MASFLMDWTPTNAPILHPSTLQGIKRNHAECEPEREGNYKYDTRFVPHIDIEQLSSLMPLPQPFDPYEGQYVPGGWPASPRPDQIFNRHTIALMCGALPVTHTESRRSSVVPISPAGRMNHPQPNLLYQAAKRICLGITSRFNSGKAHQIHRTRVARKPKASLRQSPRPETPPPMPGQPEKDMTSSNTPQKPALPIPEPESPVQELRCANIRFKARLGLITPPPQAPSNIQEATPSSEPEVKPATDFVESPGSPESLVVKPTGEAQLRSPFPILVPSLHLRSPFQFGTTPEPEPRDVSDQDATVSTLAASPPAAAPGRSPADITPPTTPVRYSPSEQLFADIEAASREPSPPISPTTPELPYKTTTSSPPMSGEMSAKQEKRYLTRSIAKQKEQAAKELSGYNIEPLSKEWEAKVEHALKHGHGEYTTHDLIKVVPPMGSKAISQWLNDETINGYLKLVTNLGNRAQNPGATPKFHAFTSFFMTNLLQKGYEGVARWSKRAKIDGKRLHDVQDVYIPVNRNSHWTMLVVSPKKHTIRYYDSLGYPGCGSQYIAAAKTWLQGELGAGFKGHEWATEDFAASPRQNNGSDCGVFAITSAKQIMLGRSPMDYGPADIPVQRRRIVAELIGGKLM